MSITYRGERFSGYNKPKRTPGKSKSLLFLLKKAKKYAWYALATPICLLKKAILLDGSHFVLDTVAIRVK